MPKFDKLSETHSETMAFNSFKFFLFIIALYFLKVVGNGYLILFSEYADSCCLFPKSTKTLLQR
jgi:hypothetical protein